MKKIIALIILGTAIQGYINAQKLEITAFTGYSFNSKINTYYGKFKVQDNPNYGGILGVSLAPDLFIEFLYNRTDTRMQYYYLNNPEPLDFSTEYYQLGGVKQMGPGPVKPFGAVSLGMIRFNLKQSGGDFSEGTAWRLAPTLGGGVKILLGEKLGVRLQARLGMPLDFTGLWLSGGTGGVSTSAGFRIPLVQFDLSAGLILRL